MQLEQDPIHRHKDVLAHTIAVVAKTSPRSAHPARGAAARRRQAAHARLRPAGRDVPPPRGGRRAHGPRAACSRCATRTISSTTSRKLVELHLRFHTYRMGWTDSAVRRYVRDAGPLLDDLNELHALRLHDARRAQGRARSGAAWTSSRPRIAELREHEELAKIRPALDGNQVMKFLGVAPGPIVGEALDFLLELRLDEGPMSEDEAYARLAAWARGAGHRTAAGDDDVPRRVRRLLCGRARRRRAGCRGPGSPVAYGSGSSSSSTR